MDICRYADLFLSESREHLTAFHHLPLGWERDDGAREPLDGLFHVEAEAEALRGHFLLMPDLAALRAILQAIRLT